VPNMEVPVAEATSAVAPAWPVAATSDESSIESHTGGRRVQAACVRSEISSPAVSRTHLVIIPSFNSGPLLERTVAAARAYWAPICVVIDGSTDDTATVVEAMAGADPALRVLLLPSNRGKGEAVRQGLIAARASGFTHALVMDADGQHPADRVPAFMAASAAAPDTLVMGHPMFGADAPWIRVVSRKLCNACAALITLREVGDTLFGFRVYPIAPLLHVMRSSHGMRRFDFDPEAVIRLAWGGTPLVHLPAPVRYLSRTEEGVSHFRYVRDNLLLAGMFLRLSLAAIVRFGRAARARWSGSFARTSPKRPEGPA
jgi:glycosyltransferase involved in cell wall biosynthesis